MASQAQLFQRLQQRHPPELQRDTALELLSVTNKRQYIDRLLTVLSRDEVKATLDDSQRQVLREKALYYFEHFNKDKAGLIREQLVRLLAQIGNPNDEDVYLLAVNTYFAQPVTDVTQNCRAAGLIGLVTTSDTLAGLYATKLLGEADTSDLNGEPSLTALSVLSTRGYILPIYQFLLRQGEAFILSRKAEVVGKALELLDKDFPDTLYRALAEQFIPLDVPIVSAGLVNYITQYRRESLYDLLDRMLNETRDVDFHKYILIILATARDDQLTDRLIQLAKVTPLKHIPNYLDALDLTHHPEHDALITMLEKRD